MQLIIDEADVVLPEMPGKNQKPMLDAYDTIVRRAGIFGVGVTLITQRPAVISKNVLTQAEVLICLQISGIDQDAVDKHWIKRHGTAEQREEMLASLAGLKKGDAWIWSPSWLNVFRRVRARERETFNSSATPEVGKKIILPKRLASVDIAALGERIKNAADTLKQNDPTELKKRVADLEAKLKTAENKPAQAAPNPKAPKTIEVPIISEADFKRINRALDIAEISSAKVAAANIAIEKAAKRIEGTFGKLKSLKTPPKPIAAPLSHTPAAKAALRPAIAPHAPRLTVPAPQPAPGVTPQADWKPDKCQKAILGVLSQFQDGCGMSKIALLAKYAVSGGFRNSLGILRTQGCLVGGNTETMRITEAGLQYAHGFPKLPEGDDLILFWKQHPAFSLCHRSIITVLHESGDEMPDGLMMEEIAARCNPPYAVSGGFRNALGELRTAGVIIGKNMDRMKLNPEMF